MKIGPADPEILGLRANESGTKQNWLPWQRPLRKVTHKRLLALAGKGNQSVSIRPLVRLLSFEPTFVYGSYNADDYRPPEIESEGRRSRSRVRVSLLTDGRNSTFYLIIPSSAAR